MTQSRTTDSAKAVLIRHADVDHGADADPALNAKGRARAEELRHVLGDAGIGAIFVTGLRRSGQTAEPIAAQRSCHRGRVTHLRYGG